MKECEIIQLAEYQIKNGQHMADTKIVVTETIVTDSIYQSKLQQMLSDLKTYIQKLEEKVKNQKNPKQ